MPSLAVVTRRNRRPSGGMVISTADGDLLARVPGPVRVQMQYLCTRLDLHGGGVPSSIAVTSAVSGEGVTFIGRALAAVLGEDVRRTTCLVDADWWSVERGFAEPRPGLAELMRGTMEIDEVLVGTRYPRLSLVAGGQIEDHERTILGTTDMMSAVLRALCERFDHVILDLPAIATSTSAMTFAAAADASLLVARQGMTRVDQVDEAVADLRHTRLLGVVVNDSFVHMPATLQRRLIDA